MTKRRAEADSDVAHVATPPQWMGFSSAPPVAKRSPLDHAARAAAGSTAAPIEMARQVDVRAFGLEDRAEAVIAMGKSSWSLASLSKWRSDSLASADCRSASPSGGTTSQQQNSSSREYLRQRQRAYMNQCLASNKASSKQ